MEKRGYREKRLHWMPTAGAKVLCYREPGMCDKQDVPGLEARVEGEDCTP